MGADLIGVEVAYALPAEQVVLALNVEAGTTLRQAVERSGILARFPEIDLARNKVGVYGHLRGLDEPLADGERVEIYRELIADPKEMRRLRAAQVEAKKARAKAGKA